MTINSTLGALTIAAMMTGGAAVAQNVSANNLVTVQLSNTEVANEIAENLAQDLDVTAQDVVDLGSVQVPVGIAANVCPDVDAAALAEQKNEGGAECTAENTTNAFTKAVQKSLNNSQS